MLLTPLLSVSALAVPPLAQVTFPLSTHNPRNHHQPHHHHQPPFAIASQLHHNQRTAAAAQVDDNPIRKTTSNSSAQQPPWPPPKPASKRQLKASATHRWNRPPTKSAKDLKTLNRPSPSSSSSSYNPEPIARTTYVRTNSSSVYSVSTQVTSHVSHSISSNYSYAKDRNVFVSNRVNAPVAVGGLGRTLVPNAPVQSAAGAQTPVATDAGVDNNIQRSRNAIGFNTPNVDSDAPPQAIGVDDSEQRTKLLVLIVAAVLVLCGLLLFILYGVVRCVRATRRASRALALPIPLLPEDQTPLNAEPEQPVPMLSVQAPGYAGMERLGVPARAPLSSPSEDRSPISRRMCVEGLQKVRDNSMLTERQVRCCTNVAAAAAAAGANHNFVRTNGSRCPHHVPLPDSEWGPDRNMHLRSQYQTEITRTYIKPPPNKTALDVPEHNSYNPFNHPPLNHSSSHPYHHQQQRFGSNSGSATATSTSPTTTKPKPNPFKQFFQRISSTKSPPPPQHQPPASTTTDSGHTVTVSAPAPSPPLPSSGQHQPPSYQPPQQQHYQQTSSSASSLNKTCLSSSISDSGSISSSTLNQPTTTSLPTTPGRASPSGGGGGGGSSDQRSHHII